MVDKSEFYESVKSGGASQDDAHVYFEQWGRWDWCDIAQEATHLIGLAIGGEVEEESQISNIVSAAVAHAHASAYAAMAAALGIDADDLRITIANWSEQQDKLPPPVSIGRLMEMVEETKKERVSYAGR